MMELRLLDERDVMGVAKYHPMACNPGSIGSQYFW